MKYKISITLSTNVLQGFSIRLPVKYYQSYVYVYLLSEKYLFIQNAMVIYKALQTITCQRLNICRQVLFTEVEMLEIIVYKTSCFFTLGICLDFMIQNPFP